MQTLMLESQLIRTNGITLNVMQKGPEDGPLTLMLHGFPEFWYGWRHQINYLADLGLRLWIPDQRGYNLSDKPQGVANYSMDLLVEDIVGLIQATGREKVYLVGHDWGAMVAWWVALRYPEKLEKLVIINVPHPHVLENKFRSGIEQWMRSWYAGMFQLPWLPEKIMRFRDWEFATQALQSSSRKDTFTDNDLEEYKKAWSKPKSMTSMINWYRAYVRKSPANPEDWHIHVPTLMLWGARDQFLSESMAQPSIDMCDEGELHMLEKYTHWIHHEAADEVNELIGNFLQ